MNTWLLKTTKTTAAVSERVFFNIKNLTDCNHTDVTGYIVQCQCVDLDTLTQKLIRPKKIVIELMRKEQ